MSHQGRRGSPSGGQPNWVLITIEVVKQMTAQWPDLGKAAAEDAVRLAVALVMAKIECGEPVINPGGLTHDIAYKALHTEHRRAYRHREVTNHDFSTESDQVGASPEDILLRKEFHQALEGAIFELPEKLRIPLVARIKDEISYDQIAAATGTSTGTARNRVCEAKRRVQAMMTLQGHFFD